MSSRSRENVEDLRDIDDNTLDKHTHPNKTYLDSLSEASIAAILPPGSLITFAGAVVPVGYLECDGAFISRTIYPELFTAIDVLYGPGDGSTTFNVPDLRGEFVRGYDNGKGTDVARVLGSSQDMSIEEHRHGLNLGGGSDGTRTHISVDTWDDSHSYGAEASQYYGGAETRPRNIAMMYCIKI